MLDLTKMSLTALRELYELEHGLQQVQQADMLGRILEQDTLIMGKHGRGKSLSATGISYNIRELHERPVVVIGSKMGLKADLFGPYQHLNEMAFKAELEKLNVAESEEENAEQVLNTFKEQEIAIEYAVVVFDEARKLMNSRTPKDKLVNLVGDFVMQARHYHCTLLILVPAEDEIDKRVVRQMDWKGRCFLNPYTNICRVKLVQGLEVLNIPIDCNPTPEHVSYFDMYDSWTRLGYRKSSLVIKNI